MQRTKVHWRSSAKRPATHLLTAKKHWICITMTSQRFDIQMKCISTSELISECDLILGRAMAQRAGTIVRLGQSNQIRRT